MAKLFLPSSVDSFGRPVGSSVRSNFRGPFERKLLISSLPDNLVSDISDKVTAFSVSYSISQASEISFDVVDVDLEMARNNYFILGRDIIYETQTLGRVNSFTGEVRQVRQLFEIAQVTSAQGPGGSAIYSVQCYSKAVQQMKRDKTPATIKGNGSQYVKNAAKKYGLDFYCEESSKAKNITKAKGSKQSESVWDVLDRLAKDAKFVLFEVDGVLVFASETFLLHKWGTNIRYIDRKVIDKKTKKKSIKKLARRFIPLQWPNSGPQYNGTSGFFRLIERPTITKSANDPYAGNGSCLVERFNGVQIRPGMTAYVGYVPNSSGYYLVESVSFKEMTPDPVAVGFRTLTRDEEKEAIRLLPLGQTYQQTFTRNAPLRTTKEAARNELGKPIVNPSKDKRITGNNFPTQEDPLRYPDMEYANISRTYASTYGKIPKSTNNRNSVILTGNIDLWNRPIVLSVSNGKTVGYHTLFSVEYVYAEGSSFKAAVLPTVFTEDGVAVIKTYDEVVAKYLADGGYSGSAKYLAIIEGGSRQDAVLNGRDYGLLLSIQQSGVIEERFPGISFKNFVNTPGGVDSEW
jgi:hypothetical protein